MARAIGANNDICTAKHRQQTALFECAADVRPHGLQPAHTAQLRERTAQPLAVSENGSWELDADAVQAPALGAAAVA